MLHPSKNGERYELHCPLAMPKAAGFLWNKKMMIQITCRGYAVAQFMQPEPAKYAYAPNLEAKTFMQPEQPYYAHHPGRFFYIKDEETGQFFSAPYEPVRAPLTTYQFSVGKSDLQWKLEWEGIQIDLMLSLPTNDVVELWQCTVRNVSGKTRRISIYPYFPIGHMSWMNQSALYREDLGGIVATCITPYQKVVDYFKNKNFKDKTFFLCEQKPDAWEAKQENFEGEGGLHAPSALMNAQLTCGDALYETPAAIVQYRISLASQEEKDYRFIFGPAFDDNEIKSLKERFLNRQGFETAQSEYKTYIDSGKGCLHIKTPDAQLDNFVNHWLPRQVFYHGDVNRLSTDPQTRNYLQDNMGMAFIKPEITRAAFILALSQQEESGAMPDGILLSKEAELKYINQVPHTDHCVWLPVCLQLYLDETNDYALLDEMVPHATTGELISVFDRITLAMHWLLQARDHRGLSYIAQGDWCDPMNMVGYKGKGVSGWLSVATAYALRLWADVSKTYGQENIYKELMTGAEHVNDAVNQFLWDGKWFARGISDDDVVFGVSKDKEGRIFLNPQSWAILGGAANQEQRQLMLQEIDHQLATPYGVAMFAPAYSAMREDVGRVTQKFPGSAENGSIYNHAAVFYIYSLYEVAENDRAYHLIRQMIPGEDQQDYLQRGQVPVFIPNYYRGAYQEHPRTAGRSSQLFNTGTVSWYYRCVVEGLFGLKGEPRGLRINPQLPSNWNEVSVTRLFRGATFHIKIHRSNVSQIEITLNDDLIDGNLIELFESNCSYQVVVNLPRIE